MDEQTQNFNCGLDARLFPQVIDHISINCFDKKIYQLGQFIGPFVLHNNGVIGKKIILDANNN